MTEQENKNKLIFHILLEGALAYMEGYYREETEDRVKGTREAINNHILKDNKRLNKKQIEKKVDKAIVELRKKREALPKKLYSIVEKFTEVLPENDLDKFEDLSAKFSDCLRHLLNAKNSNQIMALMKMYNDGHFDDMFKEIDDK